MPDPRYRKRGTVTMSVKYKDEPKETHFNLLVDKEIFQSFTEEQQKAQLNEGLKRTAPRKVSAIFSLNANFSFEDEHALDGFDYGNILVEAHLPYCLDIPNDYELEVLLNPPNDGALLIPRKIWTHKATSDGKLSDEFDFFADDKTLHFQNSDIITPQMPLDPRDGWEQNFTGTNLQKIKDRNGTFRFTRLYIQFTIPVKKEDFDDKDKAEILLKAIHDKALDCVNKLIDSYRFITQEEHITRLGNLSINMVYFINLKEGFYTLPANIETATMNRSKIEIESIEKMLSDGEKPPLYSLLLLDAQNSFDIKNYALAIVQSYQALDIFIENFLIDKLQKGKGLTEDQAIDYLTKDNNWKTKTRLKELLNETTGFTLEDKDKILWTNWSLSYKNVRNKVIHKGKDASLVEVKNALKENTDVINILKIL
jgi:hypothetical protein